MFKAEAVYFKLANVFLIIISFEKFWSMIFVAKEIHPGLSSFPPLSIN